MSSDQYKLDDDIQNDAFLDCVENIEIDTFTDTNLQDYFYNPFEHVDNYAVTSWRKVDTICSTIELDGVSKDLLNNLVKVAPKIVAVCQNRIGKDPTAASPADFVNIFINRDFYTLIQDYLKERMTLIKLVLNYSTPFQSYQIMKKNNKNLCTEHLN